MTSAEALVRRQQHWALVCRVRDAARLIDPAAGISNDQIHFRAPVTEGEAYGRAVKIRIETAAEGAFRLVLALPTRSDAGGCGHSRRQIEAETVEFDLPAMCAEARTDADEIDAYWKQQGA